LRNLLADYIRKLPIDLRTYVLPFIYGLFGGLAAVAFQKSASTIFSICWQIPSQRMSPGSFALFSLATILLASIIAGLILTFVSPDAAGSGIPQAKVAFWRDFGFMPVRVVFAKFFAGAISIGGGCSLGREGPTVHIAGALASNIAGWLGVAKQGRRPALLSGAAAGLAAAFNTPLSAITFVLEEIIEDLNNRAFLAQVLIASVTATFVSHTFLGDDPAFVIPSIGHFSGILYLLVIPTAALAALAGVAFQKTTLMWRNQIKRIKRASPLSSVCARIIRNNIGKNSFSGEARTEKSRKTRKKVLSRDAIPLPQNAVKMVSANSPAVRVLRLCSVFLIFAV
jgi:CIC family chloride channel protein